LASIWPVWWCRTCFVDKGVECWKFGDYKIPALSSNALIRLRRAFRFNQENWKTGKRKARRAASP
jgi:hypothetical protein